MALEYEQIAPVRTVRYALRLLEAVDRFEHGVSAGQLARTTGLPPALLDSLLAMLVEERYLRRLPGGGFVAGEALCRPAGPRHSRDLAGRLHSRLQLLREEVSAAVYFGRYEDGEVTLVDYADGPGTPKITEWVDFRASGHASAVGKCLLAQLDHDGRRDHLSRHKAARLTSRTITDERVLLATLDAHPATVPMLDLQEYALGTVCAAVPVTAGSSAGCLALSMPSSQAFRLRRAAEALGRQAAPLMLSLAI